MSSFPKDLSLLNEKYRMFRTLTGGEKTGNHKFIFSAEDCFAAEGTETCCGSRILEGYRPPFDATSVSGMKEAGGLLIGKTNMDEFGLGNFSVNSAFGVPKNPYDPNRTCGGSAGGAACAAALIDGQISIGVSSGGSVCLPASFCGVYGFVPTYGRISRYGTIGCSSSLDKVGVFSADASDLRKYVTIMSGKDAKDPASCIQPELKDGTVRKIAVPEDADRGVSPAVKKAFSESTEKLKDMGITVERIEMPFAEYAVPACHVIVAAEASASLACYCGMRYGRQDGDLTLKFDDYFTSFRSEYFGEETKRTILLGTLTGMSGYRERYYTKAKMVRQNVIDGYRSVFEKYDAILTPTVPFVPPEFGKISETTPTETYRAETFACPPDLAGIPHMSVPCGYDGDGMPIGVQFASAHWNEDALFSLAEEWKKNFDMIKPEAEP